MSFPELVNRIYIVITNELDKYNANKISELLLRDKLIACVNFKEIESHFWWEGKIDKSKEMQLIMKCKEENINQVCQKISENHSYDLPEIIYFPVSTNKDYRDWVYSI